MENLNYLVGDVVFYEKGLMSIKEHRGDNRFDLSSPKEGLIYCYVREEELTPVKLSDVWLEEKGFEHDERYWSPSGVNNEDLYDCYKKKGLCTFIKDGDFFTAKWNQTIIKLQYVHEFQHFLMGLGLDSKLKI